MKLDIKNLPALFASFMQIVRKYGVFTYLIIVLVIYGLLVAHVGILSGATPSQSAIDEQLTVTPRPQVNDNVAQKLKDLENNSPEAHTLFNQARKNPFHE